MKDGALYVAERQHSMMVKGCDWPSAEAIGEFAAERAEVAARLRDMGMGDYAV